MSDPPNKLSGFLRELKRRKVFRVISVYAAAAFVILELSDIVAPSLGMPPWTLSFIIILLIIGFIIAVILSWTYDIGPGGGIVKTEPVPAEKQGGKKIKSGGWKIISYLSMVVIVALIVLNIIQNKSSKDASEIPDRSIAVLPFQNLSEEEGNEHFVDGLVEDLLSRLSVIEQLRVISRTSSDMYRERGTKNVTEIAADLKITYIVEGSVQRYGNKARITVQLINAQKDQHLWAKSYDRDLVDVFKTQSEIALKIASELNTILTSQEEKQIEHSGTKNIQAFEYYQMGRYHWNRRTVEGYRKSLEYFNLAIETDSVYGLAYAGMADTYYLMGLQGYMDAGTGREKAVAMAQRALELDENLAEAYTVLASVYDYFDFKWEAAEKAYQRALELNPNYSTAHHYYAEHLCILGMHEEAMEHINKAIELDPFLFVKRYVQAKLYLNQGMIEESLEAISKANELSENHPWIPWVRMNCYWALQNEEKAFESFRETYDSYQVYDMVKADSVFSVAGFRGVLEWKIEIDLQQGEPPEGFFSLAMDYAMAGNDEQALYWLEQSRLHHTGAEMGVRIQFHHLHQDPRFLAILKKMGLDKYPVYGQEVPD
jgi:TolB-like protein